MADQIWYISHFDLTVRLVLSLFLGGCIGLEREWSNHAAGLRTHILVCLGSTTIMLLSMYGFSEFFINEPTLRGDPARLAAQVISGIGFLGAGAIMRTGSRVSGLTTAASIWVVAAIGLAVGAGFYYVSLVTVILVLFCLFVLNYWEKYWNRKRKHEELTVRVVDHPGCINEVIARLVELNIPIRQIQMDRASDEDGEASGLIAIGISLSAQQDEQHISSLLNMICGIPHVQAIEPHGLPIFKKRNESRLASVFPR
ncbi:MgtC/SapB family protein [Paenibacillus qinlingensis]|uniref:Mg2+ transporter-C (MgtC) family protein n=1 Tax=Paenibacillus qinlingensis TaxID=1837343 RepID=A0ABU1P190_9BACL|nr:MgtC/SapB family protein [Paenibacillus qinlingensis]MDR6553319.1 putative Mg2+ transporter-C (MgtC) family protein [Paenibacillus qinlingensis]